MIGLTIDRECKCLFERYRSVEKDQEFQNSVRISMYMKGGLSEAGHVFGGGVKKKRKLRKNTFGCTMVVGAQAWWSTDDAKSWLRCKAPD